jgi:hypothetical protein
MNVIEVKQELYNESNPEMTRISERLDMHGTGYPIDIINWKDFSYKPEVRFNIGYSRSEIFLKYYIKEDYFKADKTESNQMVCEDSCVEFFVSPSSDGIYYNIEFNAIGTCMLGYGTGREDRTHAPSDVISKIRKLTSPIIEPEKGNEKKYMWTLTLAIPLEVFFHHDITDLKEKEFRANFYKCGDKVEIPHYLTWNPVSTLKPDYHQPEYFGLLKFI